MAAPGLAHLKSVRAGHKGVVTKKISDLEDALNATPVDPDTLKQMRVVLQEKFELLKVLSAEFYFHKPITVHLELYLFYCFIHFLLYIGQY